MLSTFHYTELCQCSACLDGMRLRPMWEDPSFRCLKNGAWIHIILVVAADSPYQKKCVNLVRRILENHL